MAHTTTVDCSDIEKDERYQQLKNTLKHVSHVRSDNKTEVDESQPLLTSPSTSNITMDAFDSSTNVPSLQTFRYGSEVASSSNNFRNIPLKERDINCNKKAIATSNVTKVHEEVDVQKDHLLMPPPISNSVLCTLKKSVNVGVCNSIKTTSKLHNKCNMYKSPHPKVNETYEISNFKENYNNTLDSLQSSSDNYQHREVTIFARWKVMLNDEKELIVKGTLECGKIAQSKPIKRRLSATIIQSRFKHLYHLQGNIVDNNHELPDYVRGKFYNGFPGDWQNVYQIWRTFEQQGCKITFRWPVPMTDSDDLESEVTDLTNTSLESPKNKERSSKSFNELRIPQTPKKDIQNYSSHICTVMYKDSSTQTYASDVTEVMNRLKHTLNNIAHNLVDNNCFQECIGKFIEIFDCINYVVSYGLIKDKDSTAKCLISGPEKLVTQEQLTDASGEGLQCCHSESIPLQSDIDYSETNCKNRSLNHAYTHPVGTRPVTMNNKMTNNLLQGTGTFMRVEKNTDTNASDSESETYAEVPKILTERLSREKETLIKPYKRKITKKSIHQKRDITETQRSSVSPIEYFAKALRLENIHCENFDDSSVSITEDEAEFSKMEGDQWESLNEIMRDRNTHEVQEHFVNENSTFLHRTPTNICNSLNPAENNTHNITVTRKNKHVAAEVNSHTESSNDENDDENESMNYQQSPVSYEQPKKLSSSQKNDAIIKALKPMVISSVPIDIEIKNKESKSVGQQSRINLTEQKNRYPKELNEETRPKVLVQKDSPSERTRVTKISNKKFSSVDKRDSEELVSVQSSNIDSSTLKKSLEDNSEVPKDSQYIDVRKPRLLSASRPRVLCELKKFRTDPVLRRVSLRLIETINHELYELLGDLTDKRNVVPKKLHCVKDASDSSMDSFNATMSSKGRRIIPPLSYWTGERVVLKDNTPIYNPGTHDDSILSPTNNKSKDVKTPKKRSKRMNRRNSLEEPKSATMSSLRKSLGTKTPNKLKKTDSGKRKQSVMKNKIRADQQKPESSNTNDGGTGVPARKRPKLKANQQASGSTKRP